MNFVLDYRSKPNMVGFRNRSPAAGEPARFNVEGVMRLEGSESRATDSYAVAALLPGLSGPGKVLVLEGLNMEGTEAAVEFVANADQYGAYLRRIGVSDTEGLRSFEVLLKLTSVAGGFADPKVIAYRYSR